MGQIRNSQIEVDVYDLPVVGGEFILPLPREFLTAGMRLALKAADAGFRPVKTSDGYGMGSVALGTEADEFYVNVGTTSGSLNAIGHSLILKGYDELREYSGNAEIVDIVGSGIAGRFVYDAADNTNADNGGTVIVGTEGKRWKRLFGGVVIIDWFGSTGDALNKAATELTSGGELFVPRAVRILPSAFVFSGQRLRMIGEGQNSSMFYYSPAAAGSAIKFDNGTAGGVYQGKISGFGFSAAAANTAAKTAIELNNCADTEISHIGIASGSWAGDSIGVRCYGRQTLSLHHSEIACARPLVFSKNPTWPMLNVDHFDVYRCELSGLSATRPVIEFEDGVAFSTMTLRNLAITGGKDGILWNDTTSAGASFDLGIQTVRFEQGMDATGYCINLASTAQNLQTLTVRDATLDIARNGIRLRNAQRVILENVSFNQGAGKTCLDMTFVPGSRLKLINCFGQVGGAFTLTNAKCIRRENNAAGILNEEWIYDDGGTPGSLTSDVSIGGVAFSLAPGADVKISTNSFTGHVDVAHSGGVAATFLLAGTNNITFKVADGSGQFSINKGTASSTNVYWDATTATYRMQNNTGATKNYAVFRRGNNF